MRKNADRATWILAVVVAVGLALLCWNQIARTLGDPILIQLSVEQGAAKLPVPHGGTATVGHHPFLSASVQLTHLSPGLQGLIALEIVGQFLLIAVVLLGIGNVWIRTSLGNPFARSVTVSLVVVAIALAVVGTGTELLASFIGTAEAGEAIGGSGISSTSDYYYGAGITVSGTWLIVGFLVGVLASAFGIGAWLDREKQRLERDKERLERDTEGLV